MEPYKNNSQSCFDLQFECQVNFKSTQRNQNSKKFYILYFEEVRNFQYKLLINSPNQNHANYTLDVNKTLQPKYGCYNNENKNIIMFQLIQNQNNIMKIKFVDDFEMAGKFRHALCALIWQNENKKFIDSETNENDIFKILKDQNHSVINLIKNQKFDFYGRGSFSYSKNDKMFLIDDECFLLIEKINKSESQIRIMNQNKQTINHFKIIGDFVFQVFKAIDVLYWVDYDQDQDYQFQFFEMNQSQLQKLQNLIEGKIIESNYKQPLEMIQKKKSEDWKNYYINRQSSQLNISQGNNFNFDDSKMILESLDDNKIKSFCELKTLNKAIVNKEKEMVLYDINNNLKCLTKKGTIPEIKLQDQSCLNIGKMKIFQNNQKMVLQDEYFKDSIYYTDLERGKVITEYKDPNGDMKDYTIAEGKQINHHSNVIFATTEKNLSQFDIRAKQAVNSRYYKTKHCSFNKIQAVDEKKIILGSQNGDIRLYNQIGTKKNAKNIIPSLYENKTLFIDTTCDGSLILVTFEKNIVLLKTDGYNKSAFDYCFRKDQKPKPILLQIDPRVMRKRLKFKSAHFDIKKNEKESLIVGTTSKLQIIWSLDEVLNNNNVTDKFSVNSYTILQTQQMCFLQI